MFCRLCLILLFPWLFIEVCPAQAVPESVRSLSSVQMSKLVERAGAQAMFVVDLKVRLVGNRIVFDVTFAKNTDNVHWVLQMNLPDAQLKSLSNDYEVKGYTRAVETSVRANRKRLHSVVWVKHKESVEPLMLPTGPVPETGFTDNRLRPVDEMMRSFLKEHNVVGGTLAIARGQRLVYARGFGYRDIASKQPMQPDTQMRLASISKSITGVLVMMLVEQGQLSLDDKVVPVLQAGDYRVPTADRRWNDITVRNLLQHAGGWDRSVSDDPMFEVITVTKALKLRKMATAKDILRYQLRKSLDFAPGDKHAYSNFGYSILGRVVEIILGKPFHQCVAELILVPRQMRHTRLGKTRLEDRGPSEARYYMQKSEKYVPFWSCLDKPVRGRLKVHDPVPEPYGRWDLEVMDSHGGWVSTAPDLLRFLTGLTSDSPLLTDASLTEMLAKPQVRESDGKPFWYGCGWNVRAAGRLDRPLDCHTIWHNGALAGTSTILVRRSDGYSWAVLFNTDKSKNGERLTSLIDSQLYAAIDSVEFWPDYDLFEQP